jgi:hypothetical protein
MRVLAILVIAAVVGAACSAPPEEQAPRTAEEQRAVDSTVGASRLPGAQGVQGALRASDSAAARQRLLDSLSGQP